MQASEFKKIIKTFADSEESVLFERDKFMLSFNDIVIDASITLNDNDIYVIENEKSYKAQNWITYRLARIDLLANRVLEKIDEDIFFIEPNAKSNINEIEDQPEISDAASYLVKKIDERSALETNIIYLTSGAGEGKTSLINKAAQIQAEKFVQKESNWVLLPISLGGRPFLRFDDITIGALQNRYRFPHLYYESFIALVQMGIIVPAFDGFEEMFVETGTGEAITAMGMLVQALNSQGTLVIAARKAYFEFEDMQASERMFETINDYDVYFSKIEIQRWNREKFIEYGRKRGLDNIEYFYDSIADVVTPKHPILTRAVLATKLVDILESSDSIESFINNINSAASDFFSVFVFNLLEREAMQKWIDRSGQGEIGLPLLSVEEHFALLSEISLTMWESRTDFLKDDMLRFVVDYFCNTYKKTPSHTNQIVERIKTHALLAQSEDAHLAIKFDHEDFKNFFLGEAAFNRIKTTDSSANVALKSIFRRDIFPATAKDALIRAIVRNAGHVDVERYLRFTLNAAMNEASTSYTHINYASLIIGLINGYNNKELDISNISFGVDALKNIKIENINFNECFFEASGLDFSVIKKCSFTKCKFNKLRFNNTSIESSTFDDCTINELSLPNSDIIIWNPSAISNYLKSIDINFVNDAIIEDECETYIYNLDQELTDLNKITRYLKRSTRISENIIHMKLGTQSKSFIDNTIPLLISNGILEEIKHKGRGSKRQFKLLIPYTAINILVDKAKGKFQDFLEYSKTME